MFVFGLTTSTFRQLVVLALYLSIFTSFLNATTANHALSKSNLSTNSSDSEFCSLFEYPLNHQYHPLRKTKVIKSTYGRHFLKIIYDPKTSTHQLYSKCFGDLFVLSADRDRDSDDKWKKIKLDDHRSQFWSIQGQFIPWEKIFSNEHMADSFAWLSCNGIVNFLIRPASRETVKASHSKRTPLPESERARLRQRIMASSISNYLSESLRDDFSQVIPRFRRILVVYLDGVSISKFNKFFVKSKRTLDSMKLGNIGISDSSNSDLKKDNFTNFVSRGLTHSANRQQDSAKADKQNSWSHIALPLLRYHALGVNSPVNYNPMLAGNDPAGVDISDIRGPRVGFPDTESNIRGIKNDSNENYSKKGQRQFQSQPDRNTWLFDIAEELGYETLSAYSGCHFNCEGHCHEKLATYPGYEYGGYLRQYLADSGNRQPGFFTWPSEAQCEAVYREDLIQTNPDDSQSSMLSWNTLATAVSDVTSAKAPVEKRLFLGDRLAMAYLRDWMTQWIQSDNRDPFLSSEVRLNSSKSTHSVGLGEDTLRSHSKVGIQNVENNSIRKETDNHVQSGSSAHNNINSTNTNAKLNNIKTSNRNYAHASVGSSTLRSEPTQRKFGVAVFEETHQYMFLERIDEEVNKLLTDLFYNDVDDRSGSTTGNNNNNDDLAVILLSDHGLHYGEEYIRGDGYVANKRPFAYVMLPREFAIKHREEIATLSHNAHMLTSPFDIRTTILYWITGRDWSKSSREEPHGTEESRDSSMNNKHAKTSFDFGSQFGENLMSVRLHRDRNCETAGIPRDFCGCNLIPCSEELIGAIGKALPQIAAYANQQLVLGSTSGRSRDLDSRITEVCRPLSGSELDLVDSGTTCTVDPQHRIHIYVEVRNTDIVLAVSMESMFSAILSSSSQEWYNAGFNVTNVITASRYGSRWSECESDLASRGVSDPSTAIGPSYWQYCYCHRESYFSLGSWLLYWWTKLMETLGMI